MIVRYLLSIIGMIIIQIKKLCKFQYLFLFLKGDFVSGNI